jgi:hypothetical protein
MRLHEASSVVELVLVVFAVLVGLGLNGCASTPRRESVAAYRVFDVQSGADPRALAGAAKTAMTVRADNLDAIEGTVPEPLPERAPSFIVSVRQMPMPFGMSVAMPVVQCRDPYVLISNQGGFATGGTSQLDAYTGCIYPYRSGTSIQFVLISTTHQRAGLQGLINRAIKGAFGGNEGSAETYMDQIEAKLRALLPAAQLVRTSKAAPAK